MKKNKTIFLIVAFIIVAFILTSVFFYPLSPRPQINYSATTLDTVHCCGHDFIPFVVADFGRNKKGKTIIILATKHLKYKVVETEILHIENNQYAIENNNLYATIDGQQCLPFDFDEVGLHIDVKNGQIINFKHIHDVIQKWCEQTEFCSRISEDKSPCPTTARGPKDGGRDGETGEKTDDDAM